MLMSGSAGGLVFTGAATAFSSVWNAAIGLITGNELLMVVLFGGLAIFSFKAFKKARKSVGA